MDKQYFSLFNPPDKLSELRREQEEYDNDDKKQNIKETEKTNIKKWGLADSNPGDSNISQQNIFM